jgi:methyl-accepting chemotaxis protein
LNTEWIDARGVRVFGASMCPQVEKDWKWALMVEQDEAEVMEPVRSLRSISLIIGLLSLIFASLTALFVAKSISDPIQKLTKTANDISQGELDAQVEKLDRKDEIGDLARSFERMRVAFKILIKEQKK